MILNKLMNTDFYKTFKSGEYHYKIAILYVESP